MRTIIRYIYTRGLGQEVRQRTYDGAAITIGRGTDQIIQIPDRRLPLAHSKISISASGLSIRAQPEQRCIVNDQVTRFAPLMVGDSVNIAGHKLMIQEGEEGAAFVIAVNMDSEHSEALRDRFVTRVRQVGAPIRQIAWLLFVLIIGLGLLFPVLGFFTGMDWLRSSTLPDDGIWSSGDLDSTHAFMAENCNYCHSVAFAQTRDDECLACHRTIEHHFDTISLGRDYKVADACGDCHQEHSASGSITRSDEEVCVVCHADLQGTGFDSERLRSASDFLLDHPPFKITVQSYGEDGLWHRFRVDPEGDTGESASGLLFPHDVHLAQAGIEAPEGMVVLACTDCHVSEKGGLRMKTVTMETHCADCHQLSFDPATPERVVPHGSPSVLMRTLREYFAYQFLDRYKSGDTTLVDEMPAAPESRSARRPGKSARPTSIAELILSQPTASGEPLGAQAHRYIEARVEDAAANLFEKQTCTQCHEIARTDDEAVPWRVWPVELNPEWMPLAEFSHDSHKNMSCGDCHAASGSKLATDILMPDIGSCRACHGGENARNLLPSSCVSCHSFHLDSQAAWLGGGESSEEAD